MSIGVVFTANMNNYIEMLHQIFQLQDLVSVSKRKKETSEREVSGNYFLLVFLV